VTNGRKPLWLTLLVAALFAAALLILQPYSADWPGRAFAKPAHRYLQAALRQDSSGLRSLSAADSPVMWGLKVGRTHTEALASWTRRSHAWIGERRGDTSEVFVYDAAEVCGEIPIVLRFVGSGDKARVLSASSRCLDP
jgi:hypothetical protein